MLTCENISCERGERTLFSNVGFSLFSGALMVVRGANGCGKTSLLRIMAGLLSPSAGAILWNEVNIRDEFETYCTLMHYAGHKKAINPYLTVRDNLCFWPTLTGNEILIPAASACFGLDAVLDLPCYKLSAGWLQRLQLARVMASRANLWLLDEPTTNLDADGIDRLMNAITIRCREGGIVVIASHTPVEIKGAIELRLEEFAR